MHMHLNTHAHAHTQRHNSIDPTSVLKKILISFLNLVAEVQKNDFSGPKTLSI